jgi:hypothetical protein
MRALRCVRGGDHSLYKYKYLVCARHKIWKVTHEKYNACLHRTALHKMAWIDTLDDLKERSAITTTRPSLFHDKSAFKVSH